MIFCGDISLSHKGTVQIIDLPEVLKSKYWFGNLEGTLIDVSSEESDALLQKHGVFNSFEAVQELSKTIRFEGFSAANNHIFNYGDAETTLNNIRKLGLLSVGLGKDLNDASKSISINDEHGVNYTVLSFAWRLTESQIASHCKEGVNPWTRKHSLESVRKAVGEGKQNIVVFVHWNYEMNYLPFPYDRQLAHELIDAGATAVIGCHSHRVQPVEVYKGKPIIHGLGNFLFENNVYFNGELNFPNISEEEYAFEIDNNGNYKIHVFKYNTKENALVFVKTISLTDKEEEIKNLSNITAKDYEQQYVTYFNSKPRRQRILCPIFRTHESCLSYWLKEKERDIHEALLKAVLKMRLHSGSKSGKVYK